MNDFFGKYRGKVTGNKDPLNLGRIQVEVPSVLSSFPKNWAMPCVPYAGKKVGFYAIPPVGANVWVEFEGGDPNYPIWSGCFWDLGEIPLLLASPEVKMLKTEGITLTLDDGNQGGLSIEVGQPVVSNPLQLKMKGDTIILNHSDQRMVKITAQTIELSNNTQATVKLTAEDIELTSGPIQVKLSSKDKKIAVQNGSSSAILSSDAIEIKQGGAVIKLSGSEIQIALNPAAVKLSPSGIELSASPAKMNIAAANIELSHGLGNIKVAPAGVNINNGALEVT